MITSSQIENFLATSKLVKKMVQKENLRMFSGARFEYYSDLKTHKTWFGFPVKNTSGYEVYVWFAGYKLSADKDTLLFFEQTFNTATGATRRGVCANLKYTRLIEG